MDFLHNIMWYRAGVGKHYFYRFGSGFSAYIKQVTLTVAVQVDDVDEQVTVPVQVDDVDGQVTVAVEVDDVDAQVTVAVQVDDADAQVTVAVQVDDVDTEKRLQLFAVNLSPASQPEVCMKLQVSTSCLIWNKKNIFPLTFWFILFIKIQKVIC